LVQSGTQKREKPTSTVIIQGKGTIIKNNESLIKRAKRKTVTRSLILALVDVSKNTALTELSCIDNQLKSLDVSKNTALTDLNCYVSVQIIN